LGENDVNLAHRKPSALVLMGSGAVADPAMAMIVEPSGTPVQTVGRTR
jgi:hypothetical protein